MVKLVHKTLHGSCPNVVAAKKTISKYHDIEKEARMKLTDRERHRLDDIAKKEESKLWKRREEYLNAER